MYTLLDTPVVNNILVSILETQDTTDATELPSKILVYILEDTELEPTIELESLTSVDIASDIELTLLILELRFIPVDTDPDT